MVADSIDGFRVDGQLAVVTGASRGLGQGCALALAGAGADVALIGRSQDDLVAVAKDIQELGRTAHVLAIDVTNSEDLAAMLGQLPPFGIFVNNAGTNRPQPFLEVDGETYDMVMNLNLRAAFFAAQAAARLMAPRGGGGSIINMSSQAGHRALRDRSVYSTSKFALEGLTKAMAFELAEQSIRVNAVAPTFVETPMTQAGLAQKDFRDYVEGKIKLPRLGQIGDVAAAVLFLASPASSMITGISLLVDGGWTIH
ncbi:MAG: SDR family oxidoreductase [Alphaproteobacteria bacterium]|jgi:NAD(P)-dependent dehydrogenase (short-subunit alcohol dehydrogenase family)|nr:SDR family oxidoreductase [Alphaproteobacteria bacterium]